MIKNLEAHLQRDFKSNYVIYWNNLSRLTNMLIISNFSLFFLTELVTRDRYYYTHLSLGFLFIVQRKRLSSVKIKRHHPGADWQGLCRLSKS